MIATALTARHSSGAFERWGSVTDRLPLDPLGKTLLPNGSLARYAASASTILSSSERRIFDASSRSTPTTTTAAALICHWLRMLLSRGRSSTKDASASGHSSVASTINMPADEFSAGTTPGADVRNCSGSRGRPLHRLHRTCRCTNFVTGPVLGAGQQSDGEPSPTKHRWLNSEH